MYQTFLYFIFIWSSTRFGRHAAHHQEPKTALPAPSFAYVESCLTCNFWTLSGRVQGPATTHPTTLHVFKTRGCYCSFKLLMMGDVSPETCWTSNKYEIKNIWYTVAFCWIFFVNYTMMHGSTNIKRITLVDVQLDEQNSYLITYNTFIKILYMFRALPCSSWRGLRCNYLYAASGIVTLCRWLSFAPVKKELHFFLTGAQDSHLQRVTIPEVAYIQLRRRPPEDEQGNARNM